MNNTLLDTFLVCGIVAFTIGLLYYGQALLIPLVVAIVIWYLMVTLKNAIMAIPGIGAYLPSPIALAFSFVVIFAIFWAVSNIITSNISNLISLAPTYAARLTEIKNEVFSLLGVKEPPSIQEAFNNISFLSWLTTFASTMADIATNLFIITIYVIFLLLEYRSFDKKIAMLAGTTERADKARVLVEKISAQVQNYVKIKTFVSLITSGLSYLLLIAVGVDFADFWALLIFMLNFIPNIGSFFAVLLPCVVSLIQFQTFTPFILVSTGLIAIQVVMGNFIDPKLMGKSFNLSPLAIILALAIWSYLWGVVGMFLCVPILVIINIIFSNFSKTRPMVILMSEEGEIR